MKACAATLLAVLTFLISAYRAQANNVVWAATSDGKWSTKSNWNPNHVPGASDTAIITNSGTFTVTLDTSISVGGLVLGATNSSGTQTLLINGQAFTQTGAATLVAGGEINGGTGGGVSLVGGVWTCSGATLAGTITIANNTTLNFTTDSSPATYLNGLVLTNYGVVNCSNVTLSPTAASQIYNLGSWNCHGANSLNGTNTFNNAGMLTIQGSNNNFNQVNNLGTMTIQGSENSLNQVNNVGTLTIPGPFSSPDNYFNQFTNSGSLTIATGGVLSGNTCVLTGNSFFAGSGSIQANVSGVNAVVNGTLTVSSPNISGGITVATNSTLNLLGSFLTSTTYFNSLILTNYGTLNWSNVTLWVNSLSGFYNYGLWNCQADDTLNASLGNNYFNNYGTICKSGGSINSSRTYFSYGVPINNYGTVDIQAGLAYFEWIIDSGTINIAPAAKFISNECDLINTPNFTGGGLIGAQFVGGNAVVSGSLLLTNAELSGTITLASNALVTIANSGTVYWSYLDLQLTNYGVVTWKSGLLVDIGYSTLTSSTIYNYGLWDCQENDTLQGSEVPITFNNHGIFRKSGGTMDAGETSFDLNTVFNNFGLVDVQSGLLYLSRASDNGLINVASNALFSAGNCLLNGSPTFAGLGLIQGGFTSSNAAVYGSLSLSQSTVTGSLTLASNAVLNLVPLFPPTVGFDNLMLTNYGTINCRAIVLYSTSPVEIYNYGLWDCQTNGTLYGSTGTPTTFNNYGILRKSGGTMDTGSTFFDPGTVFINPGSMDVQIGQLSLNGTFNLAGGSINFGIASSNNYGSLLLSSGGVLAGALRVNLTNNFAPVVGNSFDLVSYGSATGTFTSVNLPGLSPGLIWQTNYGAMSFTLAVTNAAPVQLTSVVFGNNGTISFAWNALAGQTYQVQTTTNLAPANWVNVGNPIPGSNGILSTTNAIGAATQQFYRLMVSP